MKKTILLATFILPERVTVFLEYLETRFKIKKEKVFYYDILEDDEPKIIITFRLDIEEGTQLNLKKLFPSAIPIHKKGDALYSINALNKLIDKLNDDSHEYVNNKEIKIDWSEYQNKIILSKRGELTFLNISRVF